MRRKRKTISQLAQEHSNGCLQAAELSDDEDCVRTDLGEL